MLYSKLPDEQIEQLRPIIEQIVKNEVGIEMARFSRLYEESVKRQEIAKYSNVKALCDAIGITRQQVYNWEIGKVQGINISEYILKNGSRKMYDVEGIKSYLRKKNYL